ncbi:MAG: type II toxin-antitoxin system Phd/YefM family antitoxin [Thermoanaerobaculia bacterium]
MPSINASEFKAKCLGLLDEVARTGESLTILKRGRPLARLVPVQVESTGWPQEDLVGTVEILGDVVSPVLPANAWEAVARRRR